MGRAPVAFLRGPERSRSSKTWLSSTSDGQSVIWSMIGFDASKKKSKTVLKSSRCPRHVKFKTTSGYYMEILEGRDHPTMLQTVLTPFCGGGPRTKFRKTKITFLSSLSLFTNCFEEI